MNSTLQNWFASILSTPERIERLNLWVYLTVIILAFKYVGSLLTPVLLSILVAYLLQWPVVFLKRYLRFSQKAAALTAYFSFLGAIISLYVLVMPLVLKQLHNLLTQLPQLTARSRELLTILQTCYPSYISEEQIQNLTSELTQLMNYCTQWTLSTLVTSIPDIIALSIYFILVPLLIYFFLMDQEKILNWIVEFLPRRRRLILEVWKEVYTKTGQYVRGKALEIIIVWVITAVIFAWMKLPYAMLLGLLTGLSAAIPYIGTAIVTVPVVMVGFLEWGWSQDLFYLLAVYAGINLLDSHILFPFLFAEAMSLHPIAIMTATLVFGGLLGFWGVFFSIPLAVLTNSVLNTVKQAHLTSSEEQ